MPLSAAARIRDIDVPPFDLLNNRAAELRADGHTVISLGQALPFFPPPPSALDAARAALEAGDVHAYSTDPGLLSLRTALAERLGTGMHIHAREEELIITAGGNQAFTLAVTTLVGSGDEVILPAPYFTNHEMAVRAAGAAAIEAPVSDRTRFFVRWSDIEPHLTSRTRAVVLCNPSNPTGAVIGADEGRRIVSELGERGIFVVSDETYMQFVYRGSHWSAAGAPEWRRNVLVVGTFSKSFAMMGWRVGYLIAAAEICEQAIKVQDAMIICAPVISQAAVEGAVRDCWDYPRTFHPDLLRRRQALIEGIRTIPRFQWEPTDAAFFGLIRVDGCTDSVALATSLLEEAHVVTIPGAAFGRSAEGYLRLSYGFASVDALGDATNRMRRYFASH